jgi:D-alanyl-lipoteichoic acid acyltransferase DltB (MBOAT superfamily)
VFNLSLLGYFKYTGFILENISLLTNVSFSVDEILLPLAISFFTFQQIAYLVDSFKGETSEYNLLNYILFVTFFPQLIAGPIVHHNEMMTQFSSKWNWLPKYKNILSGLIIFSIGLFKKVVIADTFSGWADSGFSNGATLDLYTAWVTSLSYTFQLYFDFSGYCDMAMGVALLFNIKLPINFNSPYKAMNIQDFWRRWHITLGRFLRDYIYIPLGGSKKTEIVTYSNLMVTFLLGGLWHGASWMFLIWGALHGLALVTHRIWSIVGVTLPKVLAWFITFNFINITWIFFRAEDLNIALNIIKSMFSLQSMSVAIADISTANIAWLGGNADYLFNILPHAIVANLLSLTFILLAFFIISRQNSIEIIGNNNVINRYQYVYFALMFSLAVYVMVSTSNSVFLYFNF